jgi:hypothetical protein
MDGAGLLAGRDGAAWVMAMRPASSSPSLPSAVAAAARGNATMADSIQLSGSEPEKLLLNDAVEVDA